MGILKIVFAAIKARYLPSWGAAPQNVEKFLAIFKETEALLHKKKTLIEEEKIHLTEREILLGKREQHLENEKESLMDPESVAEKRAILLPVLREKWKAEALRIDQERLAIVQKLKATSAFFDTRIQELEGAIAQIKKRPSNQGNNDMLLDAAGRLDEIKRLLEMIDKEKNETTPAA